ncbi:hypothetical protein BD324DRAFT_623509 [Kockovaella imperatae]|uniref:Beta-glucuronidase C-terminal domain-containing protein n=1 Tax=Kockovaella imperatae TaxID=4999 RepID=A0A1Y1UIL9_9TREE|nr:hypothetical protein BD324DRAFT_623509 [Kockovaella imperatae]ORX37842.1 hypothetical protein BD324DRAFT_623509 [Kockovaella imperatae]
MIMIVLSTALLGLAAGCQVQVPCTVPEGSHIVDPSFPNLALEFATLANCAQSSPNDSSPNQYSINLMKNIFDRTGGIPIIRVGGTSADFVKYNPDIEAPVVPYPTYDAKSNVGNTTFGPNFWPLTKAFDSLGAKYIPQMPLPEKNRTQIEWQAHAIVDGLGWDKIMSIELGNEPQFAVNGAYVNLTTEGYAKMFRNYAEIVTGTIRPPAAIYQAGDIGANVDQPLDYPINIPGIFQAGVDSDGNVNAAAAHFYQVSGGSLAHLMNHSHTVYTMTPQRTWVEYLATYKNGSIPLVMDEVNVLSGPGNETIMNGLAGAIWRTDYFFYCMTIGIKRVHMESLFGSYQANWVSQASDGHPAATRAGYYSFLPVADLIGNGTDSQVAQLKVDDSLDGDHHIVYGAYNAGKLGRIAFVNFNEWESVNNSTTAPSTIFHLAGLQGACKLTGKLLQGSQGAAGLAETITYGGSQWTAESGGLEVENVQPGGTFQVQIDADGTASVPVPYTSVAIMWLEWS